MNAIKDDPTTYLFNYLFTFAHISPQLHRFTVKTWHDKGRSINLEENLIVSWVKQDWKHQQP